MVLIWCRKDAIDWEVFVSKHFESGQALRELEFVFFNLFLLPSRTSLFLCMCTCKIAEGISSHLLLLNLRRVTFDVHEAPRATQCAILCFLYQSKLLVPRDQLSDL